MSKQYTTGEIAKLCNITVRTVQFYDTKDILKPSELTEGGRRLYSKADLDKMQLICTLKSLGLPLDSIKSIFKESNAKAVLETFLEEQSRILKNEIAQKNEQQKKISEIMQTLKSKADFTLNSVNDVAFSMKSRKKLTKTFITMLAVGIILDIAEAAMILLWIFKGIWLPFAIGMPLVLFIAWLLTRLYYKNTAYICPECHETFKPKYSEFMFANHTSKTRKLTCSCCGKKSFCIETYDEVNEK